MTGNDMEYLTIALPKGKLFDLSAKKFAQIGYTAEEFQKLMETIEKAL